MEYIPSYLDDLYADIQPSYTDSLMHHGVRGQRWGVRRYQNPDGSLTSKGKYRYNHTKKLMQEADRYESAANHMLSKRDGKNVLEKALINRRIDQALRNAHDIRKKLDPEMVAIVNADKNKSRIKKRESKADRANTFMGNAMREVFGKKQIDYMDIYNEMSKDKRFKNLLDSDDNDDYKEAEKAWLQKHGYWDAYRKSV